MEAGGGPPTSPTYSGMEVSERGGNIQRSGNDSIAHLGHVYHVLGGDHHPFDKDCVIMEDLNYLEEEDEEEDDEFENDDTLEVKAATRI